MKKLTRAQQEVVELLKTDSEAYIIKRGIGWYSVDKNGFTAKVKGLAFIGLLNNNIIKTTNQKDIYVLSEKE